MKIKGKIILLVFILSILIIGTSYADTPNVTIGSTAAILVEQSTGRILYEKNSTQTLYPASTTKIMTAILTLENCNLDDMVTVSESAVSNIPSSYVTMEFVPGEEVSVRDLLYSMMLPSANDSAYILAEHIGGNVETFANMMNEKAASLGCKNTNFVNPNGIHNEKHYSTCYDLYLIANYAMKNDEFRKIVSTTEYTLAGTNKHPENDRVITTTNELLYPTTESNYYKFAVGIKTGTTTQAGNCLVAESDRDGLNFISVVLGGQGVKSNRFKDTAKLFDYGYDNYTLTKIIEKDSIVDTVEVEKATKETRSLDIAIDSSITIMNNKSLDTTKLVPEISLNEPLKAPIEKGQELGTIKYTVDDIEYSAKLYATNSVKKQVNYFLIIILFLLAIAVLFVVYKRYQNSKKRRYKKKRRHGFVY